MEKEYLSLREVCEVLGISSKTFARNRIGDKLTPYKVGKRIKYKRGELRKLQIGDRRRSL